MIYNYNPLWKQLERRNLSKTDLRTRLGCSSSTLAKLSAGQTVSLDILANIAKLLGCGLDDIVSLESPGHWIPWKTLAHNAMFCIRMAFEIASDRVMYLFGFAVPFDMPDEGIEHWKITPANIGTNFYVLEGYANTDILLAVLEGAENQVSLGQFMAKMKIDLKPIKCKSETVDMVSSATICNGKSVYRPPYILPTWNVCQHLQHASLPALSPTSNIMICESLVGLDKPELYQDGKKAGNDKKQELLGILQSEFPVCRGLADVARLGNFEVLSYPSGSCDEKCGIHIHVKKDSEKNDIVQNIYLKFDREKFKGNYIFNLIAYNGTTPIIDDIYEFYSQDTGFELTVPAYQIISRIELKVWETANSGQMRGKLIYHEAQDLIMGFSTDIGVIEHEFTIKDKWERVLSHSENANSLSPRHISHFSSSISHSAMEPWEIEEKKLKMDFKNMVPPFAAQSTGCFFPSGEMHQAEYLIWLKKCVNQKGISKVILIDPYIKPESIGVILRCAEDINQSWEIYMDSDKQGGAGRVEEIKMLTPELDLMALPYFSIRDAKGKLHDRFIILFGSDSLKVYILSNSTDTFAEKYASVACAADAQLAETICQYYLKLFDNPDLKDVYASKGIQKKSAPDLEPSKEISITLPEDIDANGKAEDADAAKQILSRFLHEGTADLVQYYKHTCCYFHSFLLQDKIVDYNLLSDGLALSDHVVNYANFAWASPALHNSAQTLFEEDLAGFLEILGQIVLSVPRIGRRDFRPGFLSVIMLYTLAEEHFYDFQKDHVLRTMLTSQYAPIRALTAILLIQQDISCPDALDVLGKGLASDEFLHTIIFILVQIQIHPKAYFTGSHKESIPIATKLLYPYFTRALRDTLSGNHELDAVEMLEGALAPLYPMYSHDIAGLIDNALAEKVIKKENALSAYEAFILKRYEDSQKAKEGSGTSNDRFLRTEDLMRSCELIDHACAVDPGILKKIGRKMKKIEIRLSGQIYQPFLKKQNYDHWKHTIDLLGCMVYIELYIIKKYHIENNRIAIEEYTKICENFQTVLMEYSEIYRAVKNLAENDRFI